LRINKYEPSNAARRTRKLKMTTSAMPHCGNPTAVFPPPRMVVLEERGVFVAVESADCQESEVRETEEMVETDSTERTDLADARDWVDCADMEDVENEASIELGYVVSTIIKYVIIPAHTPDKDTHEYQ
jgi:hypothetical protein